MKDIPLETRVLYALHGIGSLKAVAEALRAGVMSEQLQIVLANCLDPEHHGDDSDVQLVAVDRRTKSVIDTDKSQEKWLNRALIVNEMMAARMKQKAGEKEVSIEAVVSDLAARTGYSRSSIMSFYGSVNKAIDNISAAPSKKN